MYFIHTSVAALKVCKADNYEDGDEAWFQFVPVISSIWEFSGIQGIFSGENRHFSMIWCGDRGYKV